MKIKLFAICAITLLSHSLFSQTKKLRESIQEIINSKNATVGVSIAGLEDKDTLSINGNIMFPMFSVVKYYTALAVLNQVDKGIISLDKKVAIKKSDLNPDTWSPMRDSMPSDGFEITVKELIRFSIILSDNIAYEKLAELIGGISKVNDYLEKLKVKDINIVSTYKEGWEATLKNKNSPNAAVTLLKKAYLENLLSKKSKEFLWKTMLETLTGPDRIKGLLPMGTPVAHKTGSSGQEDGLTLAYNDIGIVTLPSGKHFAIAVLITDSIESDQVHASIIAEISKAAWEYYKGKK